MVKRKFNKLEINKKVRQILSSHSVDLNYLSINCSVYTINLSGRLQRVDGSDLTPETVLQLIDNLKAYGRNLVTDLENWDLNNWTITKVKEKVKTGSSSKDSFSKGDGDDIILKLD